MKKQFFITTIAASMTAFSFAANPDSKIVALIFNSELVPFDIGDNNNNGGGGLLPTPNPNFVQMYNGFYKLALDDQGNLWEAQTNSGWEQTGITGVDSISVSSVHALYLKNGNLYGKGSNSEGELGLGHSNFVSNWTSIATNVSKMYAHGGDDGCISQANTFYISGGKSYSVGSDGWGQLGHDCNGTGDNPCMAFAETNLNNVKEFFGFTNRNMALTNTGQIYNANTDDPSRWELMTVNNGDGLNSNFSDVYQSPQLAYAVKSNGDIYAIGTGEYGSLGDGTEDSMYEAFRLSLGLNNPDYIAPWSVQYEYDIGGGFALKNNEFYVVGYNGDGNLGIPKSEGTSFDRWHKTSITGVTQILDGGESLYIKKDGKYHYADNESFVEIGITVDSDGDGISDDKEIADGTDPTDDQDYIPNYNHPIIGHENYIIDQNSRYFDDGGTGNYKADIMSTITFTSHDGSKIKITFDKFKTEDGYDILYIRDGKTNSDSLIQQCEGVNCDGLSFTSTGDSMTLSFESDIYVFEGWEAIIELVP